MWRSTSTRKDARFIPYRERAARRALGYGGGDMTRGAADRNETGAPGEQALVSAEALLGRMHGGALASRLDWTHLAFDPDGVEALITHAAAATRRKMSVAGLPESFDNASFAGDEVPPALLLVKDDGIFLMSNGRPPLPDPSTPDRALVTYAEGYDPHTDSDVWSRSREALGGDAGVEAISLDDMSRAVSAARAGHGGGRVWISVSVEALIVHQVDVPRDDVAPVSD